VRLSAAVTWVAQYTTAHIRLPALTPRAVEGYPTTPARLGLFMRRLVHAVAAAALGLLGGRHSSGYVVLTDEAGYDVAPL